MHHGVFTICLAVVVLAFGTESYAGKGDRGAGRGRGESPAQSSGGGRSRSEFADEFDRGEGSGLIPGSKPVYRGPNLVLQYLSQTLHIDDITPLSPTLELGLALSGRPLSQGMEERRWPLPLSPEARDRALAKYDSLTIAALRTIVPDFGRPNYANVVLLGEAGVGKSHLTDSLTALMSYGILTPELRDMLNMGEGDVIAPLYGTSPGREPRPYELFRNSYIGKTDLVYVNMEILGQDNTQEDEDGKKKAFESQEVRIERIVKALFAAAKAEYNRVDGSGRRVGRRTLFVFEEIATLPMQIRQNLKAILDKSGFRNPNDPAQAVRDTGYMALAMTTFAEWEAWKEGEAAVERRFARSTLQEPDDQTTFEVARRKADTDLKALYGVDISDAALTYLITMKRFFSNPQLSNPGATLHTLGGIFTWFMDLNRNGRAGNTIGLTEAQLYLKEKQNWTDIWFYDAYGHPPFYNFEEKMKETVIGQDDVLEQMGQEMRSWAIGGYKDKAPIFLLAGRTGFGKGTIHAAMNRVCYRHSTSLSHLIHNLAGVSPEEMDNMLHGAANSGAASTPRGPIAEGYLAHQGIILLDEFDKAQSRSLGKLNIPLEEGELTAHGDRRPVTLNDPLLIAGEINFHEFDPLPEAQQDLAYARVTHDQLVQRLTTGTEQGRLGAFPRSLVDRITRVGNILTLRRLHRSDFKKILQTVLWPKIQKNFKITNNYNLQMTSQLQEFILDFLVKQTSGARALEALTKDLTKKALTETIANMLLPARDGSALIGITGVGTRDVSVTITDLATGAVVNTIPARRLIKDRGACQKLLVDEID